jgi:AAA domain
MTSSPPLENEHNLSPGDFLRLFHGEGHWPLVAIRRGGEIQAADFSESETREKDASDWAKRSNDGGYNIYFAVNPVKGLLARKARKEDVLEARWIWADCDPPAELSDLELEIWRQDKLAEIRAGKESVPPPTVIVDSGRGFWAFWRLRIPEPVDGRGPQTDRVESFGRGVAEVFDADAVSNIDRIARLPDFINHKTGRRAAVVEYHPERNYDLSELPAAHAREKACSETLLEKFREFIDDDAAKTAAINYLASAPLAIERHGGRATTMQVLQKCMDLGCSLDVSAELMEEHWNDRCSPPWDPDEIAYEFRGLKRYDPIGRHHLKVIERERGLLAEKFFEPLPENGESLFGPAEAAANQAPVESVEKYLGTFFIPPNSSDIPPRVFLYGTHFQRQYAGVTIAPTKVGKSSLLMVEALAMASGRDLLGIVPSGKLRVRIWNGEDPRIELERRALAVMLHYNITAADIEDQLLLDSGRDQPIVMARLEKGGAVIARPVMDALREALRRQRVDVLIVDPFVKAHRISENDNVAIDAVAAEWNRLAGECNIAIELVHHSRKLNGGEASIDDARGASSLVSAARSARVLARMTSAEGEALGRTDDWRSLFRIADWQSNMAAPPKVIDETWFELVGVDLRNARFDETGRQLRASDKVGVATISQTHGAAAQLQPPAEDDPRAIAALKELTSGAYKRDVRARDSWAGLAIAFAYGLDAQTEQGRNEAEKILRAWIASGRLAIDWREDKTRRRRQFVKVVEINEQVVECSALEELF